jgi:hypothetical protein
LRVKFLNELPDNGNKLTLARLARRQGRLIPFHVWLQMHTHFWRHTENYIARSAGPAPTFFVSGRSVIVASVRRSTLATETAFSSATRTTFVGSDDTGFHRVHIFVARCVEPIIAFAFQHPGHDHASVNGRILGDLARGYRQSAGQNLHPGQFVSFAACFLSRDCFDAAQQGKASARHDALGDYGFGRVIASSSASFLDFIFGFRGCPL